MKMATTAIISFIWMIMIFLIGFLIIGNLTAHANDSQQLTGQTATQWTNFLTYMWLAISILAFTPLVMVIVIFAGLFGALGGGGGGRGKKGD